MAGKTAVIRLDGTDYTVRKFNIGELREVMEILGENQGKPGTSLTILGVALRRAEPPVANFETLEPDAEEITSAVGVILSLAGLKKEEGESPPGAAAQ